MKFSDFFGGSNKIDWEEVGQASSGEETDAVAEGRIRTLSGRNGRGRVCARGG